MSPRTRSKKAGSLDSKSKTPLSSKNSPQTKADASLATAAAQAAAAVGHRPVGALSPQDEELFRAFQSNLLSLISHELRTPLTGVLNALSVLSDARATGKSPPIPVAELEAMAFKNAKALQRQLLEVLDLAQLESGSLHVRLHELELGRILDRRLHELAPELSAHGFELVRESGEMVVGRPLLADSHRLGRIIDLLFQALIRARVSGRVSLRSGTHALTLRFKLPKEGRAQWEAAWLQAAAGVASGAASAHSAFGGVVQSEKAFLTRSEEGMGGEIWLALQLAKLHQGNLEQKALGEEVEVALRLPVLDDEEGLRAVLTSRAYGVSAETAAVGLILLEVPKGEKIDTWVERLAEGLFRSTDAVYGLRRLGRVALVLDDCRPGAPAGLMGRLMTRFGSGTAPGLMRWGAAHAPGDTLDPLGLIDIAASRLSSDGR